MGVKNLDRKLKKPPGWLLETIRIPVIASDRRRKAKGKQAALMLELLNETP